MRIAIMGAGALGAYFGARLHVSGEDVVLIARGAHLNAIRNGGLYVESPNGDLHLTDIAATDDPSEVGEVDYVLFFTKNYDLEAAMQQAQPMFGPSTIAATFQNGITAPSVAAKIFGESRVLGGSARTPGYISAPGRIKHTDTLDTLIFGPVTGGTSEGAQRLHAALVGAGTKPAMTEDIERALWEKFVLLAATSAITTLTRLTFGQVNEVSETRNLMHHAMTEAATVAQAVRPDLPADLLEQQWAFYLGMDGQIRASMCTDLLNGKKLELDWFSGELVRLARQHGIETPVHDVALAALWPYRNGSAL